MTDPAKKKLVVFCVPSLAGPRPQFIAALEASVPLIEAAGWDHKLSQEIGNVYISAARATMLRHALDAKADVIIFLDYDLSWDPQDLVTLLETEGDVCAGTYRFKTDEKVEYMGGWYTDAEGRPTVRDDGCLDASKVPAGFLKVTKEGVEKFMGDYPELIYGPRYAPAIDLFNHGAIDRVWYGEDYAFSKRWTDKGGHIWLIPNLNIAHHSADKAFPGNLHEWLMRCPGGSKA
jgi:glycosyltransferase involved in cell wall biosynthesis